MTSFTRLLLLSSALSPAFAFPELRNRQRHDGDSKQRSLQNTEAPNGASCPINLIDVALEEANLQAEERLTSWEAMYPAAAYGRKYSPGVANDGETYCDGTDEQKYCNKIHGPWGDAIPQDGTYCLWAVLEFQDPPDFNYGSPNANTTAFGGIFDRSIESLLALDSPEEKILTTGAAGGEPDENNLAALPWPCASIVWKNGNAAAKDWIENVHRIDAQQPGYSFGFTFRGHYKAVECDKVWPTLEANNLTLEGNFSFGGLNLNPGGFMDFWNAFHDMEDMSPSLLVGAEKKCVSECEVAPCPDDDPKDEEPPEDPTASPAESPTGSPTSSAATNFSAHFVLFVIGAVVQISMMTKMM